MIKLKAHRSFAAIAISLSILTGCAPSIEVLSPKSTTMEAVAKSATEGWQEVVLGSSDGTALKAFLPPEMAQASEKSWSISDEKTGFTVTLRSLDVDHSMAGTNWINSQPDSTSKLTAGEFLHQMICAKLYEDFSGMFAQMSVEPSEKAGKKSLNGDNWKTYTLSGSGVVDGQAKIDLLVCDYIFLSDEITAEVAIMRAYDGKATSHEEKKKLDSWLETVPSTLRFVDTTSPVGQNVVSGSVATDTLPEVPSTSLVQSEINWETISGVWEKEYGYDSRIEMTIDSRGGGYYSIEINWMPGMHSNTTWTYTGFLDEDAGVMICYEGTRTDYIYGGASSGWLANTKYSGTGSANLIIQGNSLYFAPEDSHEFDGFDKFEPILFKTADTIIGQNGPSVSSSSAGQGQTTISPYEDGLGFSALDMVGEYSCGEMNSFGNFLYSLSIDWSDPFFVIQTNWRGNSFIPETWVEVTANNFKGTTFLFDDSDGIIHSFYYLPARDSPEGKDTIYIDDDFSMPYTRDSY